MPFQFRLRVRFRRVKDCFKHIFTGEKASQEVQLSSTQTALPSPHSSQDDDHHALTIFRPGHMPPESANQDDDVGQASRSVAATPSLQPSVSYPRERASVGSGLSAEANNTSPPSTLANEGESPSAPVRASPSSPSQGINQGNASRPTTNQRPPKSTSNAVLSSSIIGPLLKSGLNVLGEVLGELGLPGASVCGIVTTAIEKYEEMSANIDALNSLRTHLEHISSVIVTALKGRQVSELSEQLKDALDHLSSGLVSVLPSLQGEPKKTLTGFLMSNDNATEIQRIFDDVGRLVAVFVFEMSLAGHLTLNEVRRSIDNKALTDNIKSLPRVGASFNSNHALNKKRTVCLSGTRLTLLKEIGRWAVDRNEKSIYLLTGHAGFGKSTIVRTVAERLDALHVLGASFFFSRDDAALKSSSSFFSTLAYQLCVFDEAFAARIGHALKSLTTADMADKSPAAQLDSLIVEPLKLFNDISRTKVVIVVDALDECEDFESSDGEEWRRDIWDGLATLVERLPFIMVFLTSRPHQHLSTLVRNNPRLCINNASIEASDPDINRYLKYKLVMEAPNSSSRKWIASESEISSLESAAAGLFIVAATAVRFILNPRTVRYPSERIQDLVDGTTSQITSSKTLPSKLAAVDKMYTTVLHLSLSLDDPAEREPFQTVVGSIIFLSEQFHLERLAEFLGLESALIRHIIDNLQAIITLTDNTPQFHRSFVDYITDSTRSGELCIHQSHIQTFLAFRCFFAMGCDVGVTDTDIRYYRSYAIRYIDDHCYDADAAMVKTLSAQAGLHSTFWIEVGRCLTLAGSTVGGVSSTLLACMDTSECNKEAADILNLNIWSHEVLSEKTLRLIMSSKTITPDRFGRYSLFALQYLKTVLHHLSSDGVWRECWILPSMCQFLGAPGQRGVFSKTTRGQHLDWFLGNRGDGWAGSSFERIYGKFEPTNEARSILRQKLCARGGIDTANESTV